MNKIFEIVLELAKTLLLALLIVVPVRYFLFQPFIVSGSSMSPNFLDGDYLFVDELSLRFRDPERGEVVVFRAPPDPSSRYIKRVIGLPGETLKIVDGIISITSETGSVFELDESEYLPQNNELSFTQEVLLREGEYFVLGDNRRFSADSRNWGPLPEENVIGRVLLRAWPLPRLSTFNEIHYSLAE